MDRIQWLSLVKVLKLCRNNEYNDDNVSIIFFEGMFRAIPMSNKLCFDKDVKRSWKIHEAKLSNLRSRLGKERPERFEFLEQRPKKVALQ